MHTTTKPECTACDPEASHCEGCDDAPPEAPIKLVAFKREADGPWHLARWCELCLSMAQEAFAGGESYGAFGLEQVAALRVWTDHTFVCTACDRTCRASEEAIAELREGYQFGRAMSDARLGGSLEFCLACTSASPPPGEHVDGEG